MNKQLLEYEQYKPTKQEIRKISKLRLYDRGISKKFLKDEIKALTDFTNEFKLYVKESDKYSPRLTYDIIIQNKKGKIFKTDIGLPLISFNDRYYIDLGYIIDALSYYAYNGEDIVETEKEIKQYNKKSTQLWKLISGNEFYWSMVFDGTI